MKNQYFGDTRDLFKYDLVLEILNNTNLSNFVFIPLLTQDKHNNSNGNRINYQRARAGYKRAEIRTFLESCVKNNRRNICELENFFRNNYNLKDRFLNIHNKNKVFSNSTRPDYFVGVSKTLLRDAVILVYPDNGIEVKSNCGEKYVTFVEIRYLYELMSNSSVLIIFQFIPRVNRRTYFKSMQNRLSEVMPAANISYISDNQIVFFVLTKHKRICQQVADILEIYSKDYSLFFA